MDRNVCGAAHGRGAYELDVVLVDVPVGEALEGLFEDDFGFEAREGWRPGRSARRSRTGAVREPRCWACVYALWQLAATAGMRRGEMMGLHWAAVDLDGARLRIDRALIVTPARVLIFETPKTERSRRTVDLDAVTVRPTAIPHARTCSFVGFGG
jgi:hypothetical protein